MNESYKSEYGGRFLVAVQEKQREIHAPNHYTFEDGNGPRLLKCAKCDALYSIGYDKHYPPGNSFEALAEQLQKVTSKPLSCYSCSPVTFRNRPRCLKALTPKNRNRPQRYMDCDGERNAGKEKM